MTGLSGATHNLSFQILQSFRTRSLPWLGALLTALSPTDDNLRVGCWRCVT